MAGTLTTRPQTRPDMLRKDVSYTVASAPGMAGSVFMQRFRLCLGQCGEFIHLEVKISSVEVVLFSWKWVHFRWS